MGNRNTGQHVGPGSFDLVSKKWVRYTGSDAIPDGGVVCYDRDNITDTNAAGTTLDATYASRARFQLVEKPTSTNRDWVAGYAVRAYSAVTGGQDIEIVEFGGKCGEVYTDANCTINSTLLGVQAGSFALGTAGGEPIAIALQTVDRSSTNGKVLVQTSIPNRLTSATSIITPSSSVNSFSPNVWAGAPWEDVVLGRVRGTAIFEDFKGNYALAANQAVTSLGDHLSGYTDGTAGSTLTQLATDANGVLRLSTTTDNEDIGIMLCGASNVAGGFKFSTTGKLYAEFRIKVANITNTTAGVFIGFAEEALASNAGIISTSDTLNDKDLVGFFRVAADGDTFDVVHNTASGGGVTTLEADAVTVAADTWVNLAVVSDGTTATFYANNVEVASVLLAATNFPDGEEMAFYYVAMSSGGSDWTCDIDWAKLLYV